MTKYMPVDILSNTGLYLVVLTCFQKICGLHGVDHQIIQYLEKEKVITDRQTNKQTDRISYLRLDPFCGRGRVKISLNKCRALGCEFQYERRKRYISTGGNTVWNTEGNIWGVTRFDLHLGCPVLACRIVIRNTITSKYIKLFHTSSSSYLIFVNFSTLPHYWGL